MALTVHCPCGNHLDCDHLELVVALTCPHCNRELTLEIENEAGQRGLAVLTLVEGPGPVGDQFIMPVGQDLIIGKAPDNWLSLEGGALSDVHCGLRVSESGRVAIEDLESDTGTWIGHQRIARGRLAPMQSFSVGGFRFRLDIQSAEGTTVVAMPAPAAMAGAEAPVLPTLPRIAGKESFAGWLMSNRFMAARNGIVIFAWLAGIYHACALACRDGKSLPWLAAILVGVILAAALTSAGKRASLASGRSKFTAPAMLAALAIADLVWGLYASAIACASLAGAATALFAANPSRVQVNVAGVIGAASILLEIVTVTWRLIITLASLS